MLLADRHLRAWCTASLVKAFDVCSLVVCPTVVLCECVRMCVRVCGTEQA